MSLKVPDSLKEAFILFHKTANFISQLLNFQLCLDDTFFSRFKLPFVGLEALFKERDPFIFCFQVRFLSLEILERFFRQLLKSKDLALSTPTETPTANASHGHPCPPLRPSACSNNLVPFDNRATAPKYQVKPANKVNVRTPVI